MPQVHPGKSSNRSPDLEAGLRWKYIRENYGFSLPEWAALFKVPAPLLNDLERGEAVCPGLLTFLSAFLPLFTDL